MRPALGLFQNASAAMENPSKNKKLNDPPRFIADPSVNFLGSGE